MPAPSWQPSGPPARFRSPSTCCAMPPAWSRPPIPTGPSSTASVATCAGAPAHAGCRRWCSAARCAPCSRAAITSPSTTSTPSPNRRSVTGSSCSSRRRPTASQPTASSARSSSAPPRNPPTTDMAAALLEPALLRRLEGLALQVRRAVSGQMGGERRSRKRGRSIEFADFRNYTPGDDFRLIDWNAYARLDRFILPLFVGEEELPLSLFIDLSGSMDWGKPNKAETARRLAGAIAYVALAALDRVRLTIFPDGPTSGGAPYRGRRAAAALFARLQSLPAGGVTNYEKLVWPIGRQRPGMTVLITDGLGVPSIDPALAALQRAQPDGAVLQLLAPQELALDWSGDARLKDAETGIEREFTATPLTQGSYLRALAERTDEIERVAHRRGLRFARLSTAEPLDQMVQITLRRLGLLG